MSKNVVKKSFVHNQKSLQGSSCIVANISSKLIPLTNVQLNVHKSAKQSLKIFTIANTNTYKYERNIYKNTDYFYENVFCI